MSVSLSTFTDVSLIDSSASSGTVVLPRAGGIRYRVVVFKDRKGTFQNNPLTLNTLPGDTFEDGTTTKVFRDRFTQLWLYSDGATVWHILSGTQLAAMTVSSMTVSSIRGDGSLLTNINAISSLTLQSTLQGLGSLGYVSTASLLSTVQGLGTASYISTASLVSTTAGLQNQIQTSGALSTPNLISTVAGLGSAGYASTSFVGNAISTFSTAIGPSIGVNLGNLQSTVAGLGSASYISSAQLLSTTASYARAFQSLSISVSSLTASNAYASTLTVDNLIIGNGLGFVNIGPLQATAISTFQVNTNALYANSNYFGTTSSQTALQFYGLTGSFSNTVIAEQSTGTGTQELLLYKVSSVSDRIRMQTTGSIVFEPGVSARIWPTAPSNATPAMIIDTASNVGIGTGTPGSLLDVAGQGRFQVISTLGLWASSINGSLPLNPGQLASTVAGLGSAGYISSSQLLSTTAGLQFQFQTAGFLSTPNLVSTTQGLNTLIATSFSSFSTALASPLYFPSLQSTVAGLGSASYVSSAQLVSTTAGLQTQFQTAGFLSSLNLTSSVAGLGSAGYLSSINVPFLSSFSLSTGQITVSTLYFIDINTQAQQLLLVSSGVLTLNGGAVAVGGGGGISVVNLQSTVAGLGSASYISSLSLVSTTQGIQNQFQTAGFLSTANLISTVEGLGSAGYASTSFVGNAISTFSTAIGGSALPPTAFTSTVAGLGSAGYISSSQLLSTTAGLQFQFQTAGFLSTANLVSTTQGLNTVIATSFSSFSTALALPLYFPSLQSTVAGLGSASYVSTATLFSTTIGIYNFVSTFIDPVELTSTVVGLGSASFVSSIGLQARLQSTVEGLGSAGYASTSFVGNAISTFSSAIGAAALPPTAFTSTVAGLGSAGYISTASLISTTAGIQFQFQTAGFLSTPNLTSTVAGLGSAGYASTSFVGNAISTFSTAIGASALPPTAFTSTVAGLGSAGYASTSYVLQQISSFSTALGSVGAGNLTTANLTSTVQGLGSASYISSSQLISTVAGLASGTGSSGYPSTVSTAYGTTFTTGILTVSTTTFLNVQQSGPAVWVATGSDSTQNNTLKYSTDGITWLNSAGSGFTGAGYAAAWNGRLWVAVGLDSTQNNTIKYSLNGTTWSNAATNGFIISGRGVAWNGRLWVAVGNNDVTVNGTFKYSTDGSNWTNSVGTGFDTQGLGIAWNGSMWVAVGQDSTPNNTIKYSYDGISWSNSSGSGFSILGWGIAWNGRMWVATGLDATANNRVKYSYDGINWFNSAGASFSGNARGIAWNGTLWVAVGIDSTANNTIKYSGDGINWSNSAGTGFTAGGWGVGWNGRLWIAVGDDSTANNRIKYSLNGINWSNSSGSGFSIQGLNVGFTSNLTATYQQSNLSILPQPIPLFLTSTNTIFLQPSSMTINNTIDIDAIANRVGINTNLPEYSLDVAGSLNTSSFFINKSSFTTILTSTVAGIGSAGGGVSQTVLTSTVIGLGTIGYISTPGGGGGVQTSNLISTVEGLGTAGYASTIQSQYSFFTVRAGTSYTGEPWTEELMSLSNLGLFNAPVYLEPDNITLRLSTTTNLTLRVSYMTGGNNNTLTTPRPTITMALSTPTDVSYFPSVENFEGGGGSVSFIQNFDSASRLLFYMRGLSNYTFGTIDGNLYRMTFEVVGQTQTLNVLSNISSLSSIIDNLYTQNTRVTTELIVDRSSITTSAFAVNLLANDINVRNSTTTFSMYADTTRTLNSTISRAVHTDYLRVMSNAIIGCNSVVIRDDTVFASSIQVSTVNILDQSTMRFVPLSISSGSIYLNNVLASAGGGGGGGGGGIGGSTLSSLFVGSSSNQNFIKFWGQIGEYNNTAIVQQSTGGGTTEFLFFEGSSINDQFRFQTTGNIRFETGVAGPRDVNTANQIATPTMIINSSSNVGINTANPSFNLDVAGSGRFQTLMSTVQVFSGALYLGVFFA